MPKLIPGDSVRQVATCQDELARLRNFADAAITATTTGTPVELLPADDASCKAIIKYQAYTGYAAGTAEWVISIEAADNVAGPFAQVGSIALDGGPSVREIAFTGAQVHSLVPDATHLQVTATLVGGAGALTYGVDVIPVMI